MCANCAGVNFPVLSCLPALRILGRFKTCKKKEEGRKKKKERRKKVSRFASQLKILQPPASCLAGFNSFCQVQSSEDCDSEQQSKFSEKKIFRSLLWKWVFLFQSLLSHGCCCQSASSAQPLQFTEGFSKFGLFAIPFLSGVLPSHVHKHQ